MTENRKCFTFIWKIKNFNLRSIGIYSPLFKVNELSGTEWKLRLVPDSGHYKDSFACYIDKFSGPTLTTLEFELSLVAFDGSLGYSIKGSNDLALALCAKREEVFILKKDILIPNNILTICCKMWDSQSSMSQSGRCFAETRIETDSRYFIGTIEKFSCVEPGEKYQFCIKSPSTDNFLASMNLHVAVHGMLTIEIEPAVPFYNCTVFILDVFGNKVKSGKGDFYDKSHCIPLTLLKEHLIENKEYYLPNKVLTIECEITFPTGDATNSIEDPEYGFDYLDTPKIISNTMKMKRPSEEYHSESLTLKDDLNSLFKEGILCDMSLKTNTETFPVHKAVLSARSPVFKSMFTTEMSEKTSNCVDIDDLDADTVRRMLKFMYLDTLDDLDYESVKSLSRLTSTALSH